jgi:hypothetical protein
MADSGKIDFFEITYRSGDDSFSSVIMVQCLMVEQEGMLWVDGIDFENPVVVPLGGLSLAHCGTFDDWLAKYPAEFAQVTEALEQERSPVFMSRCVALMAADSSIGAAQAIEMCLAQAHEIIKEDNACFLRECG